MTAPRLAAAIVAEEGRKTHAYPDPLTGGKPWTIGVGHTDGDHVYQGLVWTDAQIDAALAADIAKAEAGLDKTLPWWRSLCDVRQDCLVQMTFQMGLDGLLAFHRTLGFVQDHQYDAAAEGMLASLWARQTPHRAKRLAELMRTGAYPE